MAGNLLLKNVTTDELKSMKRFFANTSITGLMHAQGTKVNSKVIDSPLFQGWSTVTTQYLNNAIEVPVALNDYAFNRERLPPHIYIQFELFPNLSDAQKNYLRTSTWVSRLQYPKMGLTGLPPSCKHLGPLFATLNNQQKIDILQAGLAAMTEFSLEVYYNNAGQITETLVGQMNHSLNQVTSSQ